MDLAGTDDETNVCGIAGFVGLPPAAETGRIERMLEALRHRGPDAGGSIGRAGWQLGARRLAVIDLSTGDQPVSNESGSVHAVLNGEIYNYRELRTWLLERGHVLRSQGDTEVLVHLWEELGTEVPTRLRGMFAFAIVDEGQRTLFLARDRVGKKPLYMTSCAGGLHFASEPKALWPVLPTRPSIVPAGLAAFLAYGFVPEGVRFLGEFEKLEPASWALFDLDGTRRAGGRYWQLDVAPGQARVAPETLLAKLDEATTLRLRSDVPLAVFLSGGLDSGAVTALAARAVSGLRALTVRVEGNEDELPLARLSAARAGVDLVPIELNASEGVALLPRLAEVFDEPLADPSCIPTFMVARAARRHATVVLNGDGGDEALCGYRRFLAARLLDVRWGRLGGRAVAAGLAVAGRVGLAPQGWGARLARGLDLGGAAYGAWGPAKLTADEVRELLGPEVEPAAPNPLAVISAGRDPLSTMRALDLGFFLPGDLLVKMDRATMACSLEARSPFLDHELLELACAIPTRALLRGWRTKAMLRDATVGLLPDAVRRAPKRGFEVPLERWLEHEWAGEVTTVLEDGGAAIRSLIPSERLRSFRGWRSWPDRTRGARAVYTLIVLEHWLRRWPATL